MIDKNRYRHDIERDVITGITKCAKCGMTWLQIELESLRNEEEEAKITGVVNNTVFHKPSSSLCKGLIPGYTRNVY